MDLISRVFPTRPPAPKENPNNKAKEGKFRRSQTCFSLGCGDFNASVYIYPTPPVCALIMSRFFLYSNYTLIELEKKMFFRVHFKIKQKTVLSDTHYANRVVLLHSRFHLLWFQVPVVNLGSKPLLGKFQK